MQRETRLTSTIFRARSHRKKVSQALKEASLWTLFKEALENLLLIPFFGASSFSDWEHEGPSQFDVLEEKINNLNNTVNKYEETTKKYEEVATNYTKAANDYINTVNEFIKAIEKYK